MSLSLVTVRARTRGKSPVEFTYEGVGKLEPRKVLDKEGNAIKREDGSEVEVDDLDVEGLLTEDSLPDVLELFSGNMLAMLTASLGGYNIASRKAASPVTEVVTEDELTPLIAAMKSAEILDDKSESVWRRNVTSSAKLLEMDRIVIAMKSGPYKALVATGWKPEATV